MLKINDIRSDNTKKLHQIELGGFFFYDDVLCRRLGELGEIKLSWTLSDNTSDSLPVMEMARGKLFLLDRNNWVEPIADRQVFVEISD